MVTDRNAQKFTDKRRRQFAQPEGGKRDSIRTYPEAFPHSKMNSEVNSFY